MSSAAREQIMGRLRRGANNPEFKVDRERRLPQFQPLPFRPRDLVPRWRQELEALSGRVYGPLPPIGALDQFVKLAQVQRATAVLSWEIDELPVDGLAERLQAAKINLVRLKNHEQDDAVVRREIEQIPLGVTAAIAGLADTGSLVVNSGAGRPRSASLLPPVHVALLPVSNLYPDLPTWMALEGERFLSTTANVVIITGPSKTADIELNLVMGVHGPGEVHVILIE